MDNPEVINLLDHIFNQVANSNATAIINIISSTPPKPDTASVAATTDAEAASILGIPQERKYSQVRRYIHERCRFDPEFKHRVEDSSRVELCTFLTQRFGWVVDPNSLGKNMNRKH